MRLSIKLTVRKSARSALAELNVGICVQRAAAEKRLRCFRAGFNRFSALYNYGRKTVFDKPYRTKQTRRSAADYSNLRRSFQFFKLRARFFRSVCGKFNRINPADIVFIARVKRFFFFF